MSGIGVLLAIAFLTTAAHCKLHPSPLHYQQFPGTLTVLDVCDIYHQPTHSDIIDSQYYFNKIVFRLNNHIQCHKPLLYNPSVHTLLTASKNMQLGQEAYRLTINQSGIFAEYAEYSGYIYALESFYQLARKGLSANQLQFVSIVDEPQLPHRGIMIDTARHFLQRSTIERLISNMPLSKLNILHWHMADDESFPVQLGSHPELAQFGNYNPKKVYTTNDVKSLISLAAKNGVKIIPEIQTPAHMRSWFLAPTWKAKNLSLSCNVPGSTGQYSQLLDPSKADALQLVKDVVTQLDDLFRDSPYIHLGGKDVSFSCWDARPEIAKTFMKLHNIKDYNGLLEYWRFQVKQALPSSRKVIYWADQVNNYTISPTDILQFSGNTSDIQAFMSNTQNMFILSPTNMSDLTTGLGNLWLNTTNADYNSWRGIYQEYSKLISSIDVGRVLGAELLAWGTMINDDNFDNNVWMRAAIFGERMWSATALPTYELVAAMVEVQRTLEENGVDVSPITSEYCEYKPQLCWPDSSPSQSSASIQIS